MQAFIPNLPIPQSQINTSLLLQSWYQRTNPALVVHPLALSHTHTHTQRQNFAFTSKGTGQFPPPQPPPLHWPGNISPPRPALTYLDIVGEIGP